MLTYDQAIARILSVVHPLPPVDAPLLDSLSLVLAEDVITPLNIPPFANSAMDGFAVRASEIANAALDHPISLPIVGESSAGTTQALTLAPHSAMRIMTGAPLPSGADAIAPIEDCGFDEVAVHIKATVEPGRYVRTAGEDVSVGAVVASHGSIMRPAEIGMCAAVGRRSVRVHPAPRVAIISTGNELIEPGNPILPGQIYDANSYALAAQVREAGGLVTHRLHARDTPDALRAVFTSCQDADIILTSGGVSVGDHDHVKAVFAERGGVDFWRVAIRPGKPFAFGTWGSARFFGLPGNPVSSMVTFELFARPALRKMRGLSDLARPMVKARLTEEAAHQPGRQSYLRAFAMRDGDAFTACPVRGQGSHQMHSMVLANALIVLPADIDRKTTGDFVDIMLLDSLSAL